MSILSFGNVKYELHIVDQFKGEHKNEKYLNINPTGSLPTLTEDRFLVLGGYLVFLTYLVNHHKAIRDRLYPKEYETEINKLMLWF